MLKDQPADILTTAPATCTATPPITPQPFSGCHHIQMLCHAMPVPVLVLDEKFQVAMANDICLELLGLGNLKDVRGLQLAFSSSMQVQLDGCHSIFVNGAALPLPDIRLDARLMEAEDQNYFVVTLTDLSQQKQKRSMEQLFFHDILNTAGGMHGISEVLLEAEPEEVPDLQDSVHNLAAQLVDEITAQRDFVAAQNGELRVYPTRLQSNILLRSLALTYCNHPATGQRHINIQETNGPLRFVSDKTLLNRVLGNMIKNALEASTYPEEITVQSALLPEEEGKPRLVKFSIHNPGYIREDKQDGIFQHSFSTKGAGRGIGTYSMRMLTEDYLGGQVSFTTDPTSGTTFSVTLPLAGP